MTDEVRADVGGEVGFVDDEEVGLDHALAGLAGDLLALGHVDDVDGEVDEFGAEGGGEVVAAGFDEDDLQVRVPGS